MKAEEGSERGGHYVGTDTKQTTGSPNESLWNLWFGVCVPIGVAGERGKVSWNGCFLRIFFSINFVFLFSSLVTLTFS